jgi:hypothetical protein
MKTLKSFVDSFTPYNQILTSEEQLCISNFFLILTKAKLTVLLWNPVVPLWKDDTVLKFQTVKISIQVIQDRNISFDKIVWVKLFFGTCRYCIEGVCQRLAEYDDSYYYSYNYNEPSSSVAPPTWSQPNNCGPPHRYELQNEDVASFFLHYITTNLLTKTVAMNITFSSYIIKPFTWLNPLPDGPRSNLA